MFHNRKELHILLLILVAAFVLRCHRLTTPLADWHSFRQADTASVTREYVKNGVDLLRPRYHDVSNIQSGKDNPQGWRMVEFPFVNALLATLLRAFPQWDLVVTSRVASILASLGSLIALYAVVRSLSGEKVAQVAATFFAVLPYNIFYSRVILPEPFLVLFAMLTAWMIERSATEKKHWVWWLCGAMVSFASALLLKPMAVFFLPLFVGIAWQKGERRWLWWAAAAAGLALSTLPVWWWRRWIQNFPEGIPVSDWLFNSDGIRLRPAWWRWLFFERLYKLVLSVSIAFLPLGLLGSLVSTFKKQKSLPVWKKLWSWVSSEAALVLGGVGFLSYLIIFATGNVRHDYYQVMLVPFLAWLWARGFVWLVESIPAKYRRADLLIIAIVCIFAWTRAWDRVKDYFNINNPALMSAGAAVQRHTPADALIIAPQFGDTAFLFQTNRRGWPLGFEIEDKIAKGAKYYVTTSQDDEANDLMRRFSVLEHTPEYVLIDLTRPATPAAARR